MSKCWTSLCISPPICSKHAHLPLCSICEDLQNENAVWVFGVTSPGMHIVQLLVLCSWIKDVKNVPHSYSQHKCQENGFSHGEHGEHGEHSCVHYLGHTQWGQGGVGRDKSLPMLADGTGPLQTLETVSRALKKPYSANWFLDFPLGSAPPFLLCAVWTGFTLELLLLSSLVS